MSHRCGTLYTYCILRTMCKIKINCYYDIIHVHLSARTIFAFFFFYGISVRQIFFAEPSSSLNRGRDCVIQSVGCGRKVVRGRRVGSVLPAGTYGQMDFVRFPSPRPSVICQTVKRTNDTCRGGGGGAANSSLLAKGPVTRAKKRSAIYNTVFYLFSSLTRGCFAQSWTTTNTGHCNTARDTVAGAFFYVIVTLQSRKLLHTYYSNLF